jgi:hypothetical protein
MSFHVYDGLTGKLITVTIHHDKTPQAGELLALLKRIVRQIRARFPDAVLIFRVNGHYSKTEVYDAVLIFRVNGHYSKTEVYNGASRTESQPNTGNSSSPSIKPTSSIND